jgi:rhodanese-related sulfurtransferase
MPTAYTLADLRSRLASGAPTVVIDVRSSAEYAEGHLDGARSVPLEGVASADLPADSLVVCVCTHGGRRSQGAAATLEGLGRETGYLVGGYEGARTAG